MSVTTKEKSKEQSHKDCFLFFKKNIFLILGMSIAAAICMYGILGIFGFSAFPDEFGYWAPAAAILGYDWSEITGLGSYYSYGYSILLLPILFLFHGCVATYRAAVILNLLMQCAAIFLVYLILEELFPKETQAVRSIIATIAVLYPAWTFYVKTTMAEGLLNFALILSVYLMLRFLKKPGIVIGVLNAVLLVYLYLVHMRCVGTIGAGAITLILWMLSIRKESKLKAGKSWLLIIGLVLLFGITFLLKDKVISVIYRNTSDDVLSWNDYSGIMFRISQILSLKGIGYLIKDICGKLLYMGLATYGIAYFGIVGCVRNGVSSLKKIIEKNASYRDFLWIYILLVVAFQFVVALIYLNGASSPNVDRLDNFLHGRYIDFFLPILFFVGCEEMLRGKKIFLVFEGTFLLYLIFSMVGVHVINTNAVHLRNAHGFTMIGMSYFLKAPLTDTLDYYYKEVIFSVLLTLFVDVIVILARLTRQDIFISFILLVQAMLGIQASSHYVFANQSYILDDILVAEKLGEISKEYPDKQVVHIFEGKVPYIELVQFENRDMKIWVVNSEHDDVNITDYLSDDVILVVPEEQEYKPVLQDFYSEKWEVGHLHYYYNP